MRVSEYEYETVKSNLTRWMTRLNRLTSFLLIKFVRGREHMRARTRTHTLARFHSIRDLTRLKERIDIRPNTEVHDKGAKYKKIKSKLAFFSESVDHVWMVYIIFAMCLCVWASLRSISLAIFFLHLLYFPAFACILLHRACINVARTNDSLTQLSYRVILTNTNIRINKYISCDYEWPLPLAFALS